ncbi:MAG: flagellar assembly protein FliW [Candidatus Eisenbacteria bacterium]
MTRTKKREGTAVWIPHGMIGFPGLTRYRLIGRGEENPFHLLQSEERDQIRFSLLEPMVILPDYEVRLAPDLLEELEIEDRAHARVFVVATVPDDPREITVDFRAPLLVNIESGVGAQVILEDERLSVRASLLEEWRRQEAETVMT